MIGQPDATGTSTVDGILRRPEVDPDFLGDQVWDGRGMYSYIPPPAPELRIAPQVELHTEFDVEIDPVTYQVLRNRFWSINLDHSDTIRRVSGSPVIVYMDDFNTALMTETGDLRDGRPVDPVVRRRRRPAGEVDAGEPERQPGHRARATSSSPTTRGSAASTRWTSACSRRCSGRGGSSPGSSASATWATSAAPSLAASTRSPRASTRRPRSSRRSSSCEGGELRARRPRDAHPQEPDPRPPRAPAAQPDGRHPHGAGADGRGAVRVRATRGQGRDAPHDPRQLPRHRRAPPAHPRRRVGGAHLHGRARGRGPLDAPLRRDACARPATSSSSPTRAPTSSTPRPTARTALGARG